MPPAEKVYAKDVQKRSYFNAQTNIIFIFIFIFIFNKNDEFTYPESLMLDWPRDYSYI